MKLRLVTRIDRSPMNEGIWVLQLICGHDVYVTQKARPSLSRTWRDKKTGERLCGPKVAYCPKCPADVSGPAQEPEAQ